MKLSKKIFALLSVLYLSITNAAALGLNPATGDESNIYTYIIIAIIAVVLIAGVIFTTQKKK